MAVIQLTPRDETFQRVRSLTGIARLILDIRLVSGLLVTIWLVLRDADGAVLAVLCVAMAWLLLVLLRWRTIGWILCTHPVVLAADAAACFVALAVTSVLSPVLLLSGTGALLTGLCLQRRGAWYFSPLYVAAWWMVYSLTPPARADGADMFLHLVIVPVLLVGALFLGAGIRVVVLRATETEITLRREMRSAGVAEERARMAREMHDSLTKSLHGMAMLADAVPRWIDRSPDRARAQAQQLSELIKGAGRESRALIHAMRRADATATASDAVRRTVDRWRKTTGRDATCETVGKPSLPTESAFELTAILDEALENVRRHTPEGASASVTLAEQEGWVHLQVVDNGPGVPDGGSEVDKDAHFGLLGMRERAARVGGQLSVTSRPGVGTTVSARLPASLDVDEGYDLMQANL